MRTTRRRDDQMRQHWFVRYAPATLGGVAAGRRPPPPTESPGAEVTRRIASVPPPLPQSIVVRRPAAPWIWAAKARRDRATSSSRASRPPRGAAAAPPSQPRDRRSRRNLHLAAVLGLDTAADAVREARQLIFESTALRDAAPRQHRRRGRRHPRQRFAGLGGRDGRRRGDHRQVPWNAAFRARTVDIDGATYGHIHIRTFYVPDADGFVEEFIRLLEQMPESGLILDVRGNGGGNIWAAERLLQTLTAAEIEPERLQFMSTPGTLDLSRNNPATSQIPLQQWRPSLEEAVETGSMYSHAFPLTSPGELQLDRPALLRPRGAGRRRQLLLSHRHFRRRISGPPHRQDPRREQQHRAPAAPTCGSTGCSMKRCRPAGGSSRCPTRPACGSQSASACASARAPAPCSRISA